MRAFIVSLVVATPAAAEPLADAELRVGYGLALESGELASQTAARGETAAMATGTGTTPVTISAIAAVKTSYEPPLAVYGGLVVETMSHTAAGAMTGVRFDRGHFRAAGGGTAIIAPRTLWGPSASGGLCTAGKYRVCGDIELTVFLGGDDAHDDTSRKVITHVQLVGAFAFDVF